MTLITITLDEDEQEDLLSMEDWTPGDNTPDTPSWRSLAGKIRRARDISPWEIMPDAHMPAGSARLEAMRRYQADWGLPVHPVRESDELPG